MTRILLRDLAPGAAYALQLRSVAGDEVSDWSRTFTVTTSADTIAPSTPTGVAGSMNGATFILTWNAVTTSSDGSTANDLDHYEVLVQSSGSGASRAYNVTNTRFEFNYSMNAALFGTPQPNVQMSVRAVDRVNNGSPYSAVSNQTNTVPATPTGLTVAGLTNSITASWNANTEDDLAKYVAHVGTSAGFTPNAGTKVWEGTATSFTYSTIQYSTDLFVKVYAMDVFGQLSATPAASTAVRPLNPVSVDTTAPGIPTGLTATLANAPDESYAIATVSWTAVTDTDSDLAEYIIAYRPVGATDWQYAKVDYTNTSTKINGLLPYTNYEFMIRSSDFYANLSNWSGIVTSTGSSNTAPSTPTAPTVSSSTMRIQVTIPGTKAAGGAMEGDVAHYEVYASTTTGFTPAAANQLGRMLVGPAMVDTFQIPTSGGTSTQTWYVKIIAVDRGGLKSAASAQATSTPGLIDSANIVDLAVTNAKINNLDANKVTAGTGFVNDLTVKSKFTLGDASTVGSIESYGYLAGSTGFHFDKNLLEINQGVIRAPALAIQDSDNIVPAEYAAFEFTPSFYNSLATPSNATISIRTTGGKFGPQCIRFTGTAVASTFYYLTPGSATYNIPVETGETYILSAYMRSNQATITNLNLRLRGNDASYIAYVTPGAGELSSTTWNRFSTSVTIPAGVTSVQLMGRADWANIGDYIEIDGIQLERKMAGSTTPSPWTMPGITSIDGAIIRTGQIVSNASVTVNGVSQPAWSINMSGGAQFGNAVIRGSLIVGTTGDPDSAQSYIASGNYVSGTTGWKIDSSGNVDFNSGSIRGNLVVDGTLQTSKLSLGVLRSNLISDPGFEESYSPTSWTSPGQGNTSQWRTNVSNGAVASAYRAPGKAHGGNNRGILLLNTSATAGDWTEFYTNAFQVEAGASYKVIWSSVANGTGATSGGQLYVDAWFGNSASTIVNGANTQILTDGAYQTVPYSIWANITSSTYDTSSAELVIPAGQTALWGVIRFRIAGVADVGVLLDDISVVKMQAGGASELTSAGLRVFDDNGDEVTAMVANRPSYFTINKDGASVASIDPNGVISSSTLNTLGDGTTNAFDDARDALYVGGEDFADRMERSPQGVVAQVYKSALVSITNIRTEYGVYEVGFTAQPGRHYRVTFSGGTIRANTGAPVVVGLVRIRRTLDGTTPSITNGAVIRSQWVGLPTNNVDVSIPSFSAQGEMTGGSTTAQDVRLLYTVNALNAGSTDWISFSNKGGTSAPAPIECVVEDLGWDVPDGYQTNSGGGTLYTGGTDSSGGGAPPASKKTYVSTWTSNSSQSRRGVSGYGNYTVNTSAPSGYGLAGYYSSSNGNQYTYIGFTGANSTGGESGKSISSAISGATVTKVELYIRNSTFYASSGGQQRFGMTTMTGQPSTGAASAPPSSGFTGNIAFSTGEGKWVTLSATALGYLTGGGRIAIVGPGTSNSQTYYSKWYMSGTYVPKLRITYTK